MLGRDFRPSRVGGANFIVNEGKLAFVSNDDRGVLRLFEYDPTSEFSRALALKRDCLADPIRRHRILRRPSPHVPHRVCGRIRLVRLDLVCETSAERRCQAEWDPLR